MSANENHTDKANEGEKKQEVVAKVEDTKVVDLNKQEEKPKIKLSKFADIFITESDTFDIKIQYYKQDGNVIVSGIDDIFDIKNECSEFTATFKYPDQGDYTSISNTAKLKTNGVGDNVDVMDFLALEFTRILCLIRKWTIDQPLTNDVIMKMHPKIVKALINKIRDKIGTDGII